MSKVVPIERGRVIRAALRKVHRAVVEDFALRTDALKVLEAYLGRLIETAPASRLAELAYSVAYITTELDLTLANIKVVLICCQCLDEQYRAFARLPQGMSAAKAKQLIERKPAQEAKKETDKRKRLNLAARYDPDAPPLDRAEAERWQRQGDLTALPRKPT